MIWGKTRNPRIESTQVSTHASIGAGLDRGIAIGSFPEGKYQEI